MVKLSAAIMAHPDRTPQVRLLQDRLDREVSTVWDLEGPPSGNAARVWRNARQGWLAHDPEATHHLLIQDDARPCQDLLAGLEEALEHVPETAIVSPYLGMGRHVPARWTEVSDRATAAGARWIRTGKLMWGVAIVMPTRLILPMIEHADRSSPTVPDDMRVAGFAERHALEVWYTWPSLVDHHRIPSLTKHRATDRFARRWLPGSALALEWGGPVVTDGAHARRTAGRSGPSRLRMAD